VTASTWTHVVITFDGSSAANLPSFYTNAVLASTLGGNVRSGTLATGANPLVIGNRAAADRALDGRLAEFARWSRILSAGEVAALAKGFTPAHFLRGLTCYVPMVRSPMDVRAGGGTLTGTVVHTHPRVILPAEAE
jgi:hypothetical protein